MRPAKAAERARQREIAAGGAVTDQGIAVISPLPPHCMKEISVAVRFRPPNLDRERRVDDMRVTLLHCFAGPVPAQPSLLVRIRPPRVPPFRSLWLTPCARAWIDY